MAVLRPFLVIFPKLHEYLSQNWRSDGAKQVWILIGSKDIHVVAQKMTRSGLKTAIYHSQILRNTLYIENQALEFQDLYFQNFVTWDKNRSKFTYVKK